MVEIFFVFILRRGSIGKKTYFVDDTESLSQKFEQMLLELIHSFVVVLQTLGDYDETLVLSYIIVVFIINCEWMDCALLLGPIMRLNLILHTIL